MISRFYDDVAQLLDDKVGNYNHHHHHHGVRPKSHTWDFVHLSGIVFVIIVIIIIIIILFNVLGAASFWMCM